MALMALMALMTSSPSRFAFAEARLHSLSAVGDALRRFVNQQLAAG